MFHTLLIKNSAKAAYLKSVLWKQKRLAKDGHSEVNPEKNDYKNNDKVIKKSTAVETK